MQHSKKRVAPLSWQLEEPPWKKTSGEEDSAKLSQADQLKNLKEWKFMNLETDSL